MAHGPSSEALELEPEAVEALLLELPEIELLGLLRRSSNYTFLSRLTGGPAAVEMLAVYKPQQGETPLWDFESGTLYQREVAAYLLAKRLGWPRIPPTVARESAPYGIGAVQLFVEGEPDPSSLGGARRSERKWLEIAVFDVVANNADRKAGHCLVDGSGQVWAIDHGLTFHADPKLRTVIWDFAGRQVPKPMRRDLERVAGEVASGDLAQALATLLSERELALLRRRLKAAAAPDWRLPEPRSAWSVPWPPV